MTRFDRYQIDQIHPPMPRRTRPIAWQQVVHHMGWWAGVALIVAALMKLGGGW